LPWKLGKTQEGSERSLREFVSAGRNFVGGRDATKSNVKRESNRSPAPSASKNEQGPTAAPAFLAFLAMWFL
jgi:hypothetical protein